MESCLRSDGSLHRAGLQLKVLQEACRHAHEWTNPSLSHLTLARRFCPRLQMHAAGKSRAVYCEASLTVTPDSRADGTLHHSGSHLIASVL